MSQNTSIDECIKLFKTHKIFINLYNDLELNPMMLYAMGAGCNVITTPSKINNSIIEDKVNGHIITSIPEIFDRIKLNTNTGDKAKETIETKFSAKEFQVKWIEIINRVSKTPFLG